MDNVQERKKYVYGEINGVPVTEEQMRVVEETQKKNVTPAESELDSMMEEFKRKKPKIKLKSGGKVSSASKRADGCAQRGKTKGRMV